MKLCLILSLISNIGFFSNLLFSVSHFFLNERIMISFTVILSYDLSNFAFIAFVDRLEVLANLKPSQDLFDSGLC